MNFVEILQEYFRAEKHLGVALAVVGVAALAAAFWVFRTQTGAFAWGLVVPFMVFGVAFGAGGAFLAIRSDRQMVELTAHYEKDPGALFAVEVPRMEQVNANWPRAKLAWSIITLVALGLILAVRREWASAVGLSLLALTITLMFTDVFAERRALIYTRALEQARSARPAP